MLVWSYLVLEVQVLLAGLDDSGSGVEVCAVHTRAVRPVKQTKTAFGVSTIGRRLNTMLQTVPTTAIAIAILLAITVGSVVTVVTVVEY